MAIKDVIKCTGFIVHVYKILMVSIMIRKPQQHIPNIKSIAPPDLFESDRKK